MTARYRRAETLVRIENISVSYGPSCVLRNFSASIQNVIREGHTQGQIVAVLGPSGMGKTQLLRCLAGLLRPTEGRVLVGAKLQPVVAGSVGVVSQHYPLLDHRTVEGNLRLAARQGEDVEAILRRFGLEGRAKLYPAQLSGGQRQRVAIAQQLLGGTQLLLMDEPFSGLDPLAKARVCDTIRLTAAADELHTTIVVTHDIESALSIADTVWLLGRERAPSGGFIPGARIVETIDLAARSLAWDPEARARPEFVALCAQLNRRFVEL